MKNRKIVLILLENSGEDTGPGLSEGALDRYAWDRDCSGWDQGSNSKLSSLRVSSQVWSA